MPESSQNDNNKMWCFWSLLCRFSRTTCNSPTKVDAFGPFFRGSVGFPGQYWLMFHCYLRWFWDYFFLYLHFWCPSWLGEARGMVDISCMKWRNLIAVFCQRRFSSCCYLVRFQEGSCGPKWLIDFQFLFEMNHHRIDCWHFYIHRTIKHHRIQLYIMSFLYSRCIYR